MWEVGRCGCQDDGLGETDTIEELKRRDTRQGGREGGREGGRTRTGHQRLREDLLAGGSVYEVDQLEEGLSLHILAFFVRLREEGREGRREGRRGECVHSLRCWKGGRRDGGRKG